jgi:hypothetical protein
VKKVAFVEKYFEKWRQKYPKKNHWFFLNLNLNFKKKIPSEKAFAKVRILAKKRKKENLIIG